MLRLLAVLGAGHGIDDHIDGAFARRIVRGGHHLFALELVEDRGEVVRTMERDQVVVVASNLSCGRGG
jgi:threonine dehydrogenase-like Zn-dependent dehydrogenase